MDILYDDSKSSKTDGEFVNLLDSIGATTLSALQEAIRDYRRPCYKHCSPRHPKSIWKAALGSDRVQWIIEQIVREEGRMKADVFKEAEMILQEMAFTDHMTFVRMLGFCLFKVQQCIYPEGIYVNRNSINELKAQITQHPVVFMPSHRSYMDFLILSVTCFCLDLPLPAIAAGMDFMGMKFVGNMLRSSGAFFMRRSFGTDRLYWALFTEYAHTILINGDRPMEFFIEGTRSRTGKSLTPKFGLLAVIAEPYLKAQTHDIVIVPVSISYDRMLEETLYAYELLGVPKPKESTSALFKATSILKENYGSIHMHFGKSMSIRKQFSNLDRAKHAFGPRYMLQLSKAESYELKKLGYDIVQQQQSNMVFTPWPLIAMILMVNLDGIEFDSLVSEVQWLKNVFSNSCIKIRWPSLSMEEVVRRCLLKFNHLVQRKSVDHLNPSCDIVNIISKNVIPINKRFTITNFTLNHLMMANYRNQVVFGLIKPALLSICINKNADYAGKTFAVSDFLQDFLFLRELFHHEFIFQPDLNEKDLNEALADMSKCGLVHVENDNESKTFKIENHAVRLVHFLGNMMSTFLESYWLTCHYFIIHQQPCNYNKAKSNVQLWISKLPLSSIKPESLSLNILSNALLSLFDQGALKLIKSQSSKVVHTVPKRLEATLDTLGTFLKNIPHVQSSKL